MGGKTDKTIIENALFLLACCGQTRNLEKRLQFTIPKNAGYRLIRIFRLPWKYKREAFAYLIGNKENFVLAFKGTGIRLFDIAIDLNLYQTPYPYVRGAGKTHEGFTFLYGLLRESIIATCNKIAQEHQRDLYITGYSLGGALAALAGLDISVHTPFRHPKIYTFGSPRVGNPRFAGVFYHRIRESIRVVNIHDYIPLEPQTPIPPPFTKNGLIYEHVKGYFPIAFQCKKGNSPLAFPLLMNHNLTSYFYTLAKFIPTYATNLCKQNRRFCPSFQSTVKEKID